MWPPDGLEDRCEPVTRDDQRVREPGHTRVDRNGAEGHTEDFDEKPEHSLLGKRPSSLSLAQKLADQVVRALTRYASL